MKLARGVTLPGQMSALALDDGGLALVERPVPQPRPGHVLVRMFAAPINPNDRMLIEGAYEVQRSRGAIAGFEGSGTVVASGGGLLASTLLGREVACAAGDGDGTWAQYVCVPAIRCAPLRRGVDPIQGAMLLTNPMTATVLVRAALRRGHRGLLQNAAAGALGRMLARLALRMGVPMVHLVRRPEQATALRALGAEHVVVEDDADADARLAALCERFAIDCAFDAIAGAATGRLAAALRPGGRVIVYGLLSQRPCAVDPHVLVFKQLSIEGFTMHAWVQHSSLLTKIATLRAAQRRLGDDLRTEVRATLPLREHARALAIAAAGGSDGKVLLLAREPADG